MTVTATTIRARLVVTTEPVFVTILTVTVSPFTDALSKVGAFHTVIVAFVRPHPIQSFTQPCDVHTTFLTLLALDRPFFAIVGPVNGLVDQTIDCNLRRVDAHTANGGKCHAQPKDARHEEVARMSCR